MSEARVIKKYPNRRLYDTEESRYITLNDVRQLVIEERAFVVIDKKSGGDITRTFAVVGNQVVVVEHIAKEGVGAPGVPAWTIGGVAAGATPAEALDMCSVGAASVVCWLSQRLRSAASFPALA